MLRDIKKRTLRQNIGYILVFIGVVGIIASAILTSHTMNQLANPNYKPDCNLNPIFSCTSVATSPQSNALGFPTPFAGMIGFAVIATIGATLLAGAKLKRWFWLATLAGATFAIVFVHWLIYEALYSIGALCLYCMVIWSVTIPLFWYLLLYVLRERHLKTPKHLQGIVRFVQTHHIDILISWYLIIIALILKRFWYYWSTLF